MVYFPKMLAQSPYCNLSHEFIIWKHMYMYAFCLLVGFSSLTSPKKNKWIRPRIWNRRECYPNFHHLKKVFRNFLVYILIICILQIKPHHIQRKIHLQVIHFHKILYQDHKIVWKRTWIKSMSYYLIFAQLVMYNMV